MAQIEQSIPIRVLVVDDHELFRRGLEMVLEGEGDIELVGEAGDGDAAVRLAQQQRPDVVLMDVRMPAGRTYRDGIAATEAITADVPESRVLMLTISDDERDLYESVKAGAQGYLLKEISIQEVAEAIRAVHAGQSLVSPRMTAKLLSEFAAMARKGHQQPRSPEPRLTERELEVLRLVAEGLNNRAIAKELYISENTVKNHVRNILEKLNLHSRMEAVVYALRQNLIELT